MRPHTHTSIAMMSGMPLGRPICGEKPIAEVPGTAAARLTICIGKTWANALNAAMTRTSETRHARNEHDEDERLQ